MATITSNISEKNRDYINLVNYVVLNKKQGLKECYFTSNRGQLIVKYFDDIDPDISEIVGIIREIIDENRDYSKDSNEYKANIETIVDMLIDMKENADFIS